MSYSTTQVMNSKVVLECVTFESIYDIYFSRIYNYVRYRTNSVENADDLTARIFERVLRNLNKYQPNKAPFASWLFSIAANELKKFYREQSRHKWLSFDQTPPLVSSLLNPEDKILEQETYRQLHEALAHLKKRERNIISLKFGGQLTNREIAKVLSLSESNVGVLLYRSIQKLKKELENKKVL